MTTNNDTTAKRTENGRRQCCRGALEQGEATHTVTTYTTVTHPDGRRFHFCDDHPALTQAQEGTE